MSYTSSDSRLYQNHQLRAKVYGASPHELILLLFDGLIMQLKLGRQAALNGNATVKDAALIKSAEIITGLHNSLSDVADSDLPYNLALLYDYMSRQCLRARMNSTLSQLDEMIALVEPLSAGWAAIAPRFGS
ncbi:MAG: flagellar protein FliS [Lentisphaeria bacterium]|jgi:flagellar protein FliS